MTTALIVVCALALVAIIVLFLTREKPPEKATPYTADVYDPYSFAPNDPDAPSIFDDPDYLSLDRSLHVNNGIEEYTLTDASSDLADGETAFFVRYFDALSHGASELYDSMFTNAYYEKYLAQTDFSEQRVYDIHLTRLSDSGSGQSAYFLVEYKIARNNGSFRRDIASDASRPVVFEIVSSGGEYKINDVHYITSE